MSEFISRNKPIFVIALVTVVTFGAIIFLASKNPPGQQIDLRNIDESELINEKSPMYGNRDARVTFVEFSDFECPACAGYHPTIKYVTAKYREYMRFVYRHLPLPQHKNAELASRASMAAHEQGKFWEYLDILFNNQEKLEREDLLSYADQLSLDKEKFESDLDSQEIADVVSEDTRLARKLGLSSTPTLILNGFIINASPAELENRVIEEISKQYPDFDPTQVSEPEGFFDSEEQEEEEEELTGNLGNYPEERKVEYTDEGFYPSTITIIKDSKVSWKNSSDKIIFLEQLGDIYDELTEPIKLEPGDTFEFDFYKPLVWSYQEMNTKAFGRITVIDRDTP
jgi:protein-disulfide isomerase